MAYGNKPDGVFGLKDKNYAPVAGYPERVGVAKFPRQRLAVEQGMEGIFGKDG